MSVNIYFKNHYMVVGKYIFVILSAFCHRKFRVMGVEKGANAFLDFII